MYQPEAFKAAKEITVARLQSIADKQCVDGNHGIDVSAFFEAIYLKAKEIIEDR